MNGFKDDWSDWENGAGKEGTDKGYKSGQCFGDTHLDIWLRSMDSAGQAQGQIEAMQLIMRVLRRIERVSRLDRARNVDLRGRLKQEGVLDTVKKRQQN